LSIAENIGSAHNRKKLVHAAVGRSIWFLRKTHFTNRPKLSDERWNRIRRAFPVWNQIEHRILRWALQVRWILGIRHHVSARTSHRRLVVASAALVPVEPNSQT